MGAGDGVLTPTFRKRSPTMFSADILAEGVSGLVPNPFGMAAEKGERSGYTGGPPTLRGRRVLSLTLRSRIRSTRNQYRIPNLGAEVPSGDTAKMLNCVLQRTGIWTTARPTLQTMLRRHMSFTHPGKGF